MWPCSSQGREKALPQTSHLWLRLCVRMCMERAGMLTYIWIYRHMRSTDKKCIESPYLVTDRALLGIG